MTPTTPSGVDTRSIRRPLGRSNVASVRPTGSASAATSSTPRAIASMRSALSVKRSTNDAARLLVAASARSLALAARISGARSRKSRAADISARVFDAGSALATIRAAARASAPIARRAARMSAASGRVSAIVIIGRAPSTSGGPAKRGSRIRRAFRAWSASSIASPAKRAAFRCAWRSKDAGSSATSSDKRRECA